MYCLLNARTHHRTHHRTYHRTYHQVPQFRPKQAFAMFERMINNLPFDQDTPTALTGTHEEL